MAIHTLILARNEAQHIARAVASATPLGPVTVIDSGSTDSTVALAEEAGASVIVNSWPGFAAQRRFALTQTDAEWVLFLDADEVVSHDLAMEIIGKDLSADGFYLKRRSLFLGRWMRHGAWGRDRVLRLFRRANATVPERAVHEEVVIEGRTETLAHFLFHYAQPDFATVGRKFADYMPLMAEEILKRGRPPGLLVTIGRAKLAFFRDYLLRGGIRDGWQGCVLAFWGSVSVVAKYAEARRLWEEREAARTGSAAAGTAADGGGS